MQWLKAGYSMITPLSQQYHQEVKPLSHHDPSIIMQSSPQIKPYQTLPGQIKEMMERIGNGTVIC